VKLTIKYKLFLTILAAVLCVIVGMLLLMQWSFNRGFLRYVNNLETQHIAQLAANLETAYAQQGDWRFLEHDRRQWVEMLLSALPEEGPAPPPHIVRRIERRLFLLDRDHQLLIGDPRRAQSAEISELHLGDQVIGYLGFKPRERLVEDRHLEFLRSQRRAFLLIALVMGAAAALLAFPLAHHLVRRIRILTGATHALAAGDFATRIEITSQDELGQLASDFNRLATALEKNEQDRRQWVADISHELRTPLAVLRGEIEALQDGVRSISPEALRSLHGEVHRLTRLVDDLYQLSLADVGALKCAAEPVALGELVTECLASFAPQLAESRIEVTLHDRSHGREVEGDTTRLHQLFDNLLTNSLRYTDPGGQLEIRVEIEDTQLAVHLLDSAPGVTEGQLEKLFERLYRVEDSRNRISGGAGLGLAIARSIAKAHHGSLTAQPSPLGGIWMTASFPLRAEGETQ